MSTNDEIVEKLQNLISQINTASSSNVNSQLPNSTDADAFLETLRQTELDLVNILPQLQFEVTNARVKGNWDEVDKLRKAEQECKKALNSVRAAIVRSTVIGINPHNLTEMQTILDEIKTASQTQRRIDFIIASLRFVRKFLG